MRALPNTGTMVGQVGLILLAQASNEVRIKELSAKPCTECGQTLRFHIMVNEQLRCPGGVIESGCVTAVK